jgi:hypothetical protein
MFSSNKYIRDIIKTYSLIVLAIFASYFSFDLLYRLIYLIILFSFYKSKNPVHYVALILVISDGPGNLFYNNSEDIISVSILKLSFVDLFAVVSLMKYYSYLKHSNYLVFKKEYVVYVFFFLFFVLYGFQFGLALSGTGSTGLGLYKAIIKVIIIFSLFITIPIMLNSKEKLFSFLNIIYSLVIVNFIIQIFIINYGGTLHHLLGGGDLRTDGVHFSNRPTFGSFINIIAFTTGLYISFSNTQYFSKKYLNIIISIAFASIIAGVTRGWILSFTFILLFSYLIKLRIAFFTIIKRSIMILILFVILMQINFVNKRIMFVVERLATLELILDGDLTAGGTNSRLTDRSEPVMKMFYKKPILGWGISSVSRKYYDVHVGNQNMLMASGLVGFSILILWLIFIGLKILKYKRSLGKYSILARNLYVFLIALMALFIIHSSSTDMYGFMTYTQNFNVYKLVFFSIFFSIINNFINLSIVQYNNNTGNIFRSRSSHHHFRIMPN